MKHQSLNISTLVILSCLWLITGCEKDSMTPQVNPQYASDVHSIDAMYKHHESEQQSGVEKISQECSTDQFRKSDDLIMKGTIATTISRKRLDIGYETAGDGSGSANADDVAGISPFAYTIAGSTTIEHETFGSIGVHITMKSSPSQRTTVGKITVQSTTDRMSGLELGLQGSSDLGVMNTESGYQFALDVISASGRFTSLENSGIGTLAADLSGYVSANGESKSELWIKLPTRPVENY